MAAGEATRPTAAGGARLSLRRRAAVAGYLFLLPNILGFLIFSSIPVLATLLISTLDWDMIRRPTFVALDNYAALLGEDAVFRQVLGNTAYYVVGTVPAGIVLSLLLALAMNSRIRGITLFRAIFFIPVITSSVAVAMIWRWLFNSDFGLINAGLFALGLNGIPWLSSSAWAMPAVIVMAIWKHLGYNMVIYLAGLQGIPPSLYEAASIDGANAWDRFRYITLPLLTPTTFFILVISMIGSFQVFDLAFILTQGGPGNATNTIVMYVYNQAFQFFHMGYAAAIAWILFGIIFTITLIQWRVQRRWVHYE
ncbi:MAG TPA: sugar ABC transporter permease [Chloroflexota bacterium]|nr:sugar ABC transporter permease [Chloroflexota bacterium]